MSANELDMRVDKIRSLKRLIEEAEAEITGIEDEIKARMTELDTDELRRHLQGDVEAGQQHPD